MIILSQNFAGKTQAETKEFRRQIPEKRVLALRQGMGHPIYGGGWVICPAGHVKTAEKEPPKKAAKRETLEEAGIIVLGKVRLFFAAEYDTGKDIRLLKYYLAHRWRFAEGLGPSFKDGEIMAHDWLAAHEAHGKGLIMLYPRLTLRLQTAGHL